MPSPTSLRSVSPESAPDRVPTPTANDFPTPAGQIFTVTKRDQGLVSPAESAFSFFDEGSPHAMSTSNLMEERARSRPMERGTPGESTYTAINTGNQDQNELRRNKSQYYTEVFSYREPNLSPRDRISKDSVITAEIKTNVIITDEINFLQDFSQHLSQRYQRPISSIFITLKHSECLLYAGTFDQAYILTMSALPSQVLPTTNKRNAALIQAFLADSLGVAATRGVVRFVSIPEENLAFNGTTVFGQIENLQKSPNKEIFSDVASISGVRSALHSRAASRAQSRRPSVSKPPSRDGYSFYPTTRPPSPHLRGPPIPTLPNGNNAMDRRAEKAQKVGKRRSFFGFFGR
ncbi:hypothetical protein IMSHALPRED_004369 [Imshaugia aleurites]|uniref:L-dopachrome isomerase n=1 Tax=Imshaugia aleurites TaxID=172621 RepID=A0A8H3F7W1_9LECA|nr:hypothetical protein IMSHALPRED_004369 [Imshaugia aleurites]